jgi:hypothetical protein
MKQVNCCRPQKTGSALQILLTLCLLFTSPFQPKAAEMPSYKGLMRIPVDLVTPEGVPLEKGQYDLEVKFEGTGYVLSFSSGGRAKAITKPLLNPEPTLSPGWVPIVGTHYLRPSTEPLLTGEERRFSKTGRAQYEEETRDWKATLRAYKTSHDTVLFVFQARRPRRQWDRLCFRLSQQSTGQNVDR